MLVSPAKPLPHFNEVDECAGLDGLVTYRLWTRLGFAAGKHAARFALGRDLTGRRRLRLGLPNFRRRAARAFHRRLRRARSANASRPCISGWAAARSRASANPGEIVWSRVFVEDGKIKAISASREVVKLPREETERRWRITTPQWPIMHAVLQGVIPRPDDGAPQSNHIQVVYATDAGTCEIRTGCEGGVLPRNQASTSVSAGRETGL